MALKKATIELKDYQACLILMAIREFIAIFDTKEEEEEFMEELIKLRRIIGKAFKFKIGGAWQ